MRLFITLKNQAEIESIYFDWLVIPSFYHLINISVRFARIKLSSTVIKLMRNPELLLILNLLGSSLYNARYHYFQSGLTLPLPLCYLRLSLLIKATQTRTYFAFKTYYSMHRFNQFFTNNKPNTCTLNSTIFGRHQTTAK